MKMMKKLAMVLLAACLMAPSAATTVHAADAIQFTDHANLATGDTLDVTCAVKGTDIGVFKVELSYDSEMLQFESGEGVTAVSDGSVTVEGNGNGTEVVRLKLTFEVLKKGESTIDVTSYEAVTSAGASITLEKGHATISVTTGDDVEVEEPAATNPVSDADAVVEVDGKSYTFVSTFADTEIPNGFEKATLSYEGTDFTVVQHSVYGMYLGYLVDALQEGAFFVYNEDDATFSPYVEVQISETTTLILLSKVSSVQAPEGYQLTTVTFNGAEFPAWQSPQMVERCLFYAMNSQGEKTLYQYDSIEDTYQRYEVAVATTTDVQTDSNDTWLGTVQEIVDEQFTYVFAGAAAVLALGLLLIIVLSVKLYNRNAELDELYDEYDIDVEEEEKAPATKKAEKKKEDKKKEDKKAKRIEEDELAGFESLDDLDFGDDISAVEEVKEVEKDDFADMEHLFLQDMPEDNDFYGDLDAKFSEKKEESTSYDEFDLDFIDLDD